MKNENKGITLIAFVVTIIVLLILAGISISMLTGQNGILNRANEAKIATINKNAEEKVKLAVMEAMTESDSGILDKDKLIEKIGNYGGTVTNNEFPLSVTMDGKNFIVESTGVVATNDNGNEVAKTDTEKLELAINSALNGKETFNINELTTEVEKMRRNSKRN